ncbi:antibiotic biosynthesis monooxygenase [Actinomyces viscosus]|uniref:Monooxygenase ycnE n=1 Tax=Actinomyces viscosus TaxID=1656 RepID=A0A448PKY5_ACTVI|nr:putative quinol monooxygenase [Actinomyces viscosus]TFH53779.1 antibiotic biosynthesis monooxygenase [Actinomyces viscosus]VEI16141.1 Putative monooxygenase ycnE [Actinomyces viscosus]
MIRIVATFHVRPDAVEEFRALAGELVKGSRAEEGSIAYDLCVARDDATSFVVLETWRDDAAVDAHNASEHFTSLVPQLVDLSAEPPSVVQYVEA